MCRNGGRQSTARLTSGKGVTCDKMYILRHFVGKKRRKTIFKEVVFHTFQYTQIYKLKLAETIQNNRNFDSEL